MTKVLPISDVLSKDELSLLHYLVYNSSRYHISPKTKEKLLRKLENIINDDSEMFTPIKYITTHGYCTCGDFSFLYHPDNNLILIEDNKENEMIDIHISTPVDKIPNKFKEKTKQKFIQNVHFCTSCGKPMNKDYIKIDDDTIFCSESELYSYLDLKYGSNQWKLENNLLTISKSKPITHV